MVKRRALPRGSLLLEGLISIGIAFMVGFSLIGLLVKAQQFLPYGEQESQALDITHFAVQQMRQDPVKNHGEVRVEDQLFEWKGTVRQKAGCQTFDILVWWKDRRQRKGSIQNEIYVRGGA